MKKVLCTLLMCTLLGSYYPAFAITTTSVTEARLQQAAVNAKPIDLAFVFDGPSDKNAQVLATFQKVITRSLLPDYKANFP